MRSDAVRMMLVCVSLVAAAEPLAAEEPEPLHVHVIAGAEEYEAVESLKAFADRLKDRYRVEVTGSWVADHAEDLPGIEHVADCDLLLVFARRMRLPEEQMAKLRDHWAAGGPVVALRTASHAFQEEANQQFDHEVLGGAYDGHYDYEEYAVVPTERGEDHPVLEGVGDIRSYRLYKQAELAEGATVLQRGRIDQQRVQPVTWVNRHEGGRTFYTSLGVPEDFEDEDFRRMLVNAIFWTTEKEAKRYRREEGEAGRVSDDPTYGYTKENPVKLGSPDGLRGGPAAERAYLRRLRDPAGEPVDFERVGSVGAGPDDHILDLYRLTSSGGETYEVYIDMYHPQRAPQDQPAPKGLSVADDQ